MLQTAGRYGLALLFVAGGALLRSLLPNVLGNSPYLAFYPAVVAAAAVGGLGPGLLAILASSLLMDLVFDETPGWIDWHNPVVLWRFIIFALGGVGISIVSGLRRRARAHERHQVEELKNSRLTLIQSEQRFRGTFENAAVGIGHMDDKGHWLRVNRKLCQIVGYSAAELLARTFWEITLPQDHERERTRYAALMSGQIDSYLVEKRYVRKDGSVIWVLVTRGLQRNASKKPLYAISVVQDISQRKAAEESLATAKVIADQARAQALAAKAVADQAKADAEHASKAKDHFLAVLSHELRNPLTPVLATASMLQQDPRLDEETRRHMEVIHRNAALEARLIDDLLDVTRISRGKVELDRHPVELGTILHHAVEVCLPDIEERRVHFALHIHEDGPYIVDADSGRLQQVFWNLLKNAIKFTPHGGCVGMRCWREADRVLVEVCDSGAGIDPEALSRIFKAFEQAERCITRQFGGLGLGLAISKALVEMHGGAITASSEGKGKGAAFRVSLPLVPAPARTATPAPGEPASARAPAPRRSLRILLVEDHGDTARILAQLLRNAGHTVQTAGDVASALELAGTGEGRGAGEFDLLLSDMGLPDGSGADLMRELRRRGNRLRGIALSGYGQEDDIRRSREAGFAQHLIKPVSAERLVAVVAAQEP